MPMPSDATATAEKWEAVAASGGSQEECSKKAKIDDSSSKPAGAAAAEPNDEKVSVKERKGFGTAGLIRTLSISMRNLSNDSLAYVDNFIRRIISKPSFDKKKTRGGGRRRGPTSRPSSATPGHGNYRRGGAGINDGR